MKTLSRHTPVVRASDAVRAGIPRTSLVRLTESGVVERVERRLYRLAEGVSYDHPDLVEAAVRNDAEGSASGAHARICK